jgi:hypothetical protein
VIEQRMHARRPWTGRPPHRVSNANDCAVGITAGEGLRVYRSRATSSLP